MIVAIHGVCYGLGLDIITACDIRLCESGALFSIKEVDAGIAADIGTLQRLPKKTGNDSLLRELALTARTFGPKEACELGLIAQRHVVEGGKEALMAHALQLAQQIACQSSLVHHVPIFLRWPDVDHASISPYSKVSRCDIGN